MSENTNIIILSATLVLLLVAIGWIASAQYIPSQETVISQRESGQYKNIIVTTGLVQEKSNKRIIANERFVGELDKDGVIIAMNKGQAVNVRNGVVLVNDMVVSADKEGYSVYRVNDPEKSVYSN